MREKLEDVRAWAKAKIATGSEPPWAWYQYMKLIETADAILAGMDARTTESSRGSDQRRERHLRLVDSTDPPSSVPPHPAAKPVQLPM